MDKNALKDKRRETVIGLLKGMSIKKGSKGGFDKDDVYACIQELCNLYEEHIDELEKNYETEIGELTKRYQKYDENNELYVSLIMEAKKSSNEIINQAKSEVDEILNNGKAQVELQEQQLEQFKADSAKERASIQAELEARKDAAEAEKAALKVEVEAEREKLEATKIRYRQQIAAMEDEFAEIRTNILGTSARLDSLKSQSEEITPEIKWDVDETETAVQFPESDVVVEDIIETPIADFAPEASEPEVEPAVEEPELSFEETFFKSEVLEEAPAAVETVADAAESEPEVAVEPAPEAEEPAEVPVEEPAEVPVEEPAEEDDIEALLSEISFDDVLEETADGEVGIEEISIEELEAIEAEIGAEFPAETAEVAEEKKSADVTEEISFEGLEELFKDEA